MSEAKEKERKKMEDLKQEVTMDEHKIDLQELCTRLRTSVTNVSEASYLLFLPSMHDLLIFCKYCKTSRV